MRRSGRRRELYYFRDQQGLEVDFMVPGRGGSTTLVECKAGRTVTPAMAAPMQRLAEAMKRTRPNARAVSMVLFHQSPKTEVPTQAVAPGVRAQPWQTFLKGL